MTYAMRLVPVFAVLAGVALPVPARAGRLSQELAVGWVHERGVESRALVGYHAAVPVQSRVTVDADVAVSMFQHAGLARLGIGAEVKLARTWDARLRAGVHHDQWNDWRVGENRATAMALVAPPGRLELGAGVTWRAPVFDPDRYASPFNWDSDMPELNLLYRVAWRFLRLEHAEASLALSNVHGPRVYNPHHVPFQLDGSMRVAPNTDVFLRCGTAVKGLSALLLSLSEVDVGLGVRHAF